MTTIHAILQDQNLTAIESPTIASGDRKTVQITVDFDSNWDGFIKSAVFFTSLDNKVYEVIMSGNTCTVPMEVLADKCYLFIGIRGNDSSGAVKTSTLIRYKIQEGSPVSNAEAVDPTPDVYQQILFAYEGTNDRVDALDAQNDALAYGESGGGKNLLNIISKTFNGSSTQVDILNSPLEANTQYTFSAKTSSFSTSTTNFGRFYFEYEDGTYSRIEISQTVGQRFSATSNGKTISRILWEGWSAGNSVTITDFQLEKGTQATDYAPYIKSVKTLCEQSDDLKMLGWTVPSEMPIQNYKASDRKFHQRVGRVDLGDFIYMHNGGNLYYASLSQFANPPKIDAKGLNTMGGKSDNYEYSYGMLINDWTYHVFYINVPDCNGDPNLVKQKLSGVYLYYELEQEIVTSVDGNEKIESVVKDCFTKGEVYTSDFDLLSVPLGAHLVIGVTSKVPSGYGLLISFNTGWDYRGYLFFSIPDGTLHYCIYNGTTQKKAWTQLG